MSVKLLAEHHLEFLSLRKDCIGSFEYTLVKMPHCWKSHVMAHVFIVINNRFNVLPKQEFSISAKATDRTKLYILIVIFLGDILFFMLSLGEKSLRNCASTVALIRD